MKALQLALPPLIVLDDLDTALNVIERATYPLRAARKLAGTPSFAGEVGPVER
jgi:hypothetical protein